MPRTTDKGWLPTPIAWALAICAIIAGIEAADVVIGFLR